MSNSRPIKELSVETMDTSGNCQRPGHRVTCGAEVELQLDVVGGQRLAPTALPSRKRPGNIV